MMGLDVDDGLDADDVTRRRTTRPKIGEATLAILIVRIMRRRQKLQVIIDP
jgi:hypothetical protein